MGHGNDLGFSVAGVGIGQGMEPSVKHQGLPGYQPKGQP